MRAFLFRKTTGRLEKNVKENNSQQENQNRERKQIAEQDKIVKGKQNRRTGENPPGFRHRVVLLAA